MAGIYGEQLLAFPEQMQTLAVYEMTPKVNGGWTVTPNSERTIRGVCQNTTQNTIKDGNGNKVRAGGLELWTRTGGLEDKFMQYQGAVYSLVGDNNWNREGGFYRYGLNKVVGNNGTEHDNATWNLGAGSFC